MKKILYVFISLIIVSIVSAFFLNTDIQANLSEVLHIQQPQNIGATVDMSQILPESKHYIINKKGQDLIDIASNLGMNTLRITNITSPKDGQITTNYTNQQWNEVLSKMHKKNMKAIILVESNAADSNFFSTEIDSNYPTFVKNYVVKPNLCSFSNILAVDIRNEPLLDDHNLAILQQSSQVVKSACPSMKVTIGSWKVGDNWHDPKGAAMISNIVDIYAVHIYGFDKGSASSYPDPYTLVTSYIHEIRKYSGNKPIIIEEFGAGNGSALTDQNTLGSQAIQKNAYIGVLRATRELRTQNVIGAVSYLLYRRTSQVDSWEILTNNANTYLPAAYTFTQY